MRGTILLVDDERSMRLAVGRVLQRSGSHVLEAEDGHEALAIWLERRAELDVVVTDLWMPRMSGLQLCREIRKVDVTAKVILMSGGHDPIADDDAAPSAVVAKPFSSEQLVALVQSMLPTRLSPA